MTPEHTKLLVFGIAYATAYFWGIAITKLRAWKQIHHWYFGLAALVIAYAITDTPPLWLIVPALALMIDDAYQHVRQTDDLSYMSPVHRAYAVVWLYVFRRFGVRLP